jgi:predicted pyridoxine 5'-phosphate oxidase superfamily flavin-nucleotide-binding protein
VVRLTRAMRSLVDRQRLGFVATVCPDGSPHLSPQGTLAVWSDTTLVFADVASRVTVRNLLENPACEIGVVDPWIRKGYRFRGRARLLLLGPTFDRLLDFYRRRQVDVAVRHMVLVDVEEVEPVVSPVYALGWSEAQVRGRWQAHWRREEAG